MQTEVGIFLFLFLPLSPPSSLLRAGEVWQMPVEAEADLGGSVHFSTLGLPHWGALHDWRQFLITGDLVTIPLWKWDFSAVMRLCREPITLPENRYPISSSVLLIRSMHFSRAHTTAFLPSCTLVHTPCWWYMVTKPRTEKLGNIRFIFAYATWNLPTHTCVHWLTQGCWGNVWPQLSQN